MSPLLRDTGRSPHTPWKAHRQRKAVGVTLTNPTRPAPVRRPPGLLVLTAAAAVTAFVAGCSGAMLAVWSLADVPDLPDRAGIETIVAAAGLPVDGVEDVIRADHLFGDKYADTPAWIGTDDYDGGSVAFTVRADDQDASSIGTSLVEQGWREPSKGDTRPRGVLVLLAKDDADLVLETYVQDGRREGTAIFRVFRQTPAMVWPVGIVVGVLAAAATVAAASRLRARPEIHSEAARAQPLLGVGLALLAPGTLWALAVLIAEGPLFSDIGATRPVPVWFVYGWWVLKPVSIVGAALCAGSAVTYAAGGRLPSATIARSHGWP